MYNSAKCIAAYWPYRLNVQKSPGMQFFCAQEIQNRSKKWRITIDENLKARNITRKVNLHIAFNSLFEEKQTYRSRFIF